MESKLNSWENDFGEIFGNFLAYLLCFKLSITEPVINQTQEYCPTLMLMSRQFLIITLRCTAVFLFSLSAIMTLNTWITDFPTFTVNFLGILMSYVVIMSPLLKGIVSYGTIRRFFLTRSQCSGNLVMIKRSSLLGTC